MVAERWLGGQGRQSRTRQSVVSPDKVSVSHAVGRGLLIEISHLLLVQLVHIHLHVCTKTKAVRYPRPRRRQKGVGPQVGEVSQVEHLQGGRHSCAGPAEARTAHCTAGTRRGGWMREEDRRREGTDRGETG